MNDNLNDELLVRRMVERWAVWRDAGDWGRFATVWHPDGVMMATWFQGPFKEFIRVTKEGWAKGVSILHFLGGSATEVAGNRAIAQTKMTISQRGMVEGVLCDVVCTGRFHGFVQKHEGEWKLHVEDGHADAQGPGGRGVVQAWCPLAGRRAAGAVKTMNSPDPRGRHPRRMKIPSPSRKTP